MEQVQTTFGDVGRCLSCKGLWLDIQEYEDLLDIAEAVDIGDPKVGKELNKVDKINCPVCPNSRLLRMVDPDQPHVWFESCPVCYGRFYDAGELLDLSEYSISDFFKQFFVKERK